MSDPDRVCCLCGDKLDSKPDLEEHISLRHWDIFDDGRPPSNNDQEAPTSSASQPDVVANGSNPGDKAAVDGDTQDVVVQDPEAARPGHSQQMGSSPKAPSPTPGPSKGNGSRATQSSPQAGPSKVSLFIRVDPHLIFFIQETLLTKKSEASKRPNKQI